MDRDNKYGTWQGMHGQIQQVQNETENAWTEIITGNPAADTYITGARAVLVKMGDR